MLQIRGINAVSIVAPSDQSFPVTKVAACLGEDSGITHLCFVHCETTTGVVNPLRPMVELATRHGARTIIDAMSSFGAVEISAREVPFDVLVTSSNKCIEGPPGVSFVVASLETLGAKVGSGVRGIWGGELKAVEVSAENLIVEVGNQQTTNHPP
ncbi:aminotransferase class V-fold PLP-dependent enzyme [Paraburkholderia sp. BR14374]|uniref:aminotransferase class V-fold PLP-dependent enzyme n=1 Tax=Paraburkholderia sp. BR14374 TaxID=3237007 RepID=UPI0034CE6512